MKFLATPMIVLISLGEWGYSDERLSVCLQCVCVSFCKHIYLRNYIS